MAEKKKPSMLAELIDVFRKHPGLGQFAVRGILLAIFLMLVQFLSLPFIDKIVIPTELFTVQYIALGGVLMFSAVVFLLLVKESLHKFPAERFSIVSAVLFGALGFLFHYLFFASKVWVSEHPVYSVEHIPLVLGARYLLFIASLLSFAFAFFGFNYLRSFSRIFRRELLVTLGFFVVFTFFSYVVQNSWFILSSTITRIEYFVMSRIFPDVTLYSSDTLGIGNFIVNIGKVCSGVESLMLFTVMYSLIFFLDRKKLRTKRMLLLFIPGLIGDFFVNILRIALILTLGVLVNPQFAVGIFHTNAGWVLFIGYFFVFWFFAYPWVSVRAASNAKKN